MDEALRTFGCFVQTAVAKINHLFGMLVSPACIHAVCFMSGIGSRSRKSALQIAGHGMVINGTGEAAIADAEIFTIPTGGRQPDFKPYIGIAGWLDHSGNAAKGGQLLKR